MSDSLSQAQFYDCIRTGAIEDQRLSNDLVWPAEVDALRVRHCEFIGIDFRQAVLRDAQFDQCAFFGCSFRSADLSDCAFQRCRFYDVDNESACDFSYAVLRNARFESCDMTTANCARVRAFGIELHRCQAAGIDFGNADFGLGIGNFAAATFTDCNLAYADFSRTQLAGADFSGSRLSHSIWHDATLETAILAGCVLDNLEGHGLVLRGADLRGAQFNRLDPRQIDLTGVRMHVDQGLEILRGLGIEID